MEVKNAIYPVKGWKHEKNLMLDFSIIQIN